MTPDQTLTTSPRDPGQVLDGIAGQAGSGRLVSRRAMLGGALGVLLAAGGGTAWALDRFVIDHVEVDDAMAYEAGFASGASTVTASRGTISGSTYTSATTAISVRKVVTGSSSSQLVHFVADITLTDPTLLRAAFAENKVGTNIIANPSVVAGQHDAVIAINGDYYGFRTDGIVVRNGIVYRDRPVREGFAVHRDGSMQVYDETTTSGARLVQEGIWQTLSFGPGLVRDGEVIAGIDSVEIDTNVGNHSVQGLQPRTGIGVITPGHLVMVVADGRADGYSRGVTMSEFARIFTGLGARAAYNLDGGGSSAMVFGGSLVNNPLGKGQQRGTSDILYIAA